MIGVLRKYIALALAGLLLFLGLGDSIQLAKDLSSLQADGSIMAAMGPTLDAVGIAAAILLCSVNTPGRARKYLWLLLVAGFFGAAFAKEYAWSTSGSPQLSGMWHIFIAKRVPVVGLLAAIYFFRYRQIRRGMLESKAGETGAERGRMDRLAFGVAAGLLSVAMLLAATKVAVGMFPDASLAPSIDQVGTLLVEKLPAWGRANRMTAWNLVAPRRSGVVALIPSVLERESVVRTRLIAYIDDSSESVGALSTLNDESDVLRFCDTLPGSAVRTLTRAAADSRHRAAFCAFKESAVFSGPRFEGLFLAMLVPRGALYMECAVHGNDRNVSGSDCLTAAEAVVARWGRASP